MLTIRKCRIEDAKILCKINREVMGYDYSVEKTMEKIKQLVNQDENGIFVAEVDDQIAGYIHLNSYDTLYFDHMKNILCLAVLPEYRGKGVATALLEAGEEWAKETCAAGIRLDSGAERLAAHTCYEKAGYEYKKMHKYFRKMF